MEWIHILFMIVVVVFMAVTIKRQDSAAERITQLERRLSRQEQSARKRFES